MTIKYLFLFVFLIIILIAASMYTTTHNTVEGFAWTPESQQTFLRMQSFLDPHKVFDVTLMQDENQASQEEVDAFIRTGGQWPWTYHVQRWYKKAIRSNPFVRIDPQVAVNHARSIYNQSAIVQILSQQHNTRAGI